MRHTVHLPPHAAPQVAPLCVNCGNWDTRDSVVGYCQEITERLRMVQEVLVHGLAPCRTSANGGCLCFDPSEDAVREACEEIRHLQALRRGAGDDYPASLNP